MNTYLVRTKADQTLMGIFCAANVSDLATIIDSVFDANECEYLQLRANEGLFIEAQFITQNGQVELVHPDDIQVPPSSEDGMDEAFDALVEPSEEALEAAERMMLTGEDEYIPPVLEPTMALADRLQQAHRTNEWRPVVDLAPAKGARPYRLPTLSTDHVVKTHSINAESIAAKLMKGTLTPATFIHNASRRHH